MNATIHRSLMFASAVLGGLGGIIALPEYEPLSIPDGIGIGCIFASSAITIVATAWRANFPNQETF